MTLEEKEDLFSFLFGRTAPINYSQSSLSATYFVSQHSGAQILTINNELYVEFWFIIVLLFQENIFIKPSFRLFDLVFII